MLHKKYFQRVGPRSKIRRAFIRQMGQHWNGSINESLPPHSSSVPTHFCWCYNIKKKNSFLTRLGCTSSKGNYLRDWCSNLKCYCHYQLLYYTTIINVTCFCIMKFFLQFRPRNRKSNRSGPPDCWASCARTLPKSVARTLSCPSQARSRQCVFSPIQIRREKWEESTVLGRPIRYPKRHLLILSVYCHYTCLFKDADYMTHCKKLFSKVSLCQNVSGQLKNPTSTKI